MSAAWKLCGATTENATAMEGNVVYFRTRRPFDRADIAVVERAIQSNKIPKLFLFVVDPEGMAITPEDHSRKLATDLLRFVGDQILFVSGALLAQGFSASLLRAAVSGILLTSPFRSRIKVGSSVEAAAGWLVEECSKRGTSCPSQGELVRGYERLRNEMKALEPSART